MTTERYSHTITLRGADIIGELQQFKAGYLKALAHPVRIRILEILRAGESSVTDIGAQLDPGVANVSQHLSVLRTAGIVTAQKSGLSVLYSVRDQEVFTVLDALREIFTHRLDSMQTTLAADDADHPQGKPGKRRQVRA